MFQWSPDRASVFGSSAEDGFLNVWDHEKVGILHNDLWRLKSDGIQFLYCFLVYFSRLNILFSFCDDRLGRKKILTYQLGFSFNMLVTGTMLLGGKPPEQIGTSGA